MVVKNRYIEKMDIPLMLTPELHGFLVNGLALAKAPIPDADYCVVVGRYRDLLPSLFNDRISTRNILTALFQIYAKENQLYLDLPLANDPLQSMVIKPDPLMLGYLEPGIVRVNQDLLLRPDQLDTVIDLYTAAVSASQTMSQLSIELDVVRSHLQCM